MHFVFTAAVSLASPYINHVYNRVVVGDAMI